MTQPARDRTEKTPRPEQDIQWTVTNLDGNKTPAQIRAQTLYGLRKTRVRSGNQITQHLRDNEAAQRLTDR